MTELTNFERQQRAADRESRSGRTVERQYLPADQRMRLDQLESANANLNEALKRISALEAHIRLHDADSSWNNYRNLYNRIEGLAREIVSLGGGSVFIPEKMERTARQPVTVDDEWLDTGPALTPGDLQPVWNQTPEGRARHKAQLAIFAAREQNKRRMAATGQGA